MSHLLSPQKRARSASNAADHHHHHHHDDDAATTTAPMMTDSIMSSPSATTSSEPTPFVCLPFYGEHKRAVSSVKLAPSRLTKHRAPICASASSDGTVKIWDLSATSSRHSGKTTTTTTTTMMDDTDDQNDTTTADSPSKNKNTKNKYLLNPTSVLVGHSRGINDVAWSSDAPMVATASDDKTLRLWDANTADALVEFRGHDNFVFCTEIYHNLLVSGSFDETVKLWDVRSGECVSTLPVHSDPVTAVSFNRDGTCLVSASHDGLIRIWDVATGECLKTIYAAGMFMLKVFFKYYFQGRIHHHCPFSSLRPFEKHSLSCNYILATGNPPVSHVTYSPNGKYILAGTLDSKLRLWNVSQRGSNKCSKTYETSSSSVVDSKHKNLHVNNKYCIVSDFMVARPDRQCIVTGSETGKIILYDINSRQVHQVLEGHNDAVLAVDAHDKMELIASGGMTQDKTVHFWAPQNVCNKIMDDAEMVGGGGANTASHKKHKKKDDR